MATRTAAPFAGISWLKDSFGLLRNRPGTLVGAGLMIFLFALLPSLLTIPLQLMNPGDMRVVGLSFVLSIAIGFAVVPLMGGYLQMLDRMQRGEPTQATDIFGPYRQGGAMRLMGFALLWMVLLIGLVALIGLTFGAAFFQWYAGLVSHPFADPQATGMAGIPPGFWIVFLSIFVVAMFAMGVSALGYGQVAIAGGGPLEALRDGVVGTVRNIVPLLMLLLASVAAWTAFCVVFFLVALLLNALHLNWLGLIVFVPLYIAFLLAIYPLMFGVMYYFWRDVCSEPRQPVTAQTFA